MNINLLKRLNSDKTFEVNEVGVSRILLNKPNQINFNLPINGIEKKLELEINNIFAEGFKVTNEFGETLDVELGVHYRGKVEGVSNSVVALTFTSDGVQGMVHESGYKFDLQKLNGFTHSFLQSEDTFDFNCESLDTEVSEEIQPITTNNNQILPKGLNPYVTNVANYCVRSFWEVDYDIFSLWGTGTTSYITSLFNASSTLFNNDGIYVALSEIKVWTSGFSVYRTYGTPVVWCDCTNALYNYRNYYTNNSLTFNGDFAHFLTYTYPCTGSTTSGSRCGASWVNGLCRNNNKFAISQLYYNTSTPSTTVYSWNVNVVTHEQGHQFGSEHTHACVWNGNNTAIDGCVPTTPSGACPNPGLPPPGGGTIMSYCHQNFSVGIDFVNGFGPQPQQRIVSRINAQTCLLPCGPLPSPQPTSTPTLTPGLSPAVTPTITMTKTPTLTSNWDCKITTRFTPPLSGNNISVSGVTFTSTYSGSVKSPFFWQPDCISSDPFINGPELGDSGLPYSYTLISDTTLSSVKVRFGNFRTSQVITITTNSGTTSLSLCQGCCVNISGNTISAQSCFFSSKGAGLNIIVTSTLPFTSLTINGTNPLPSSSFGVFFDFVDFITFGVLPTQTPTKTATPTKTINISPSVTATPTITPTKTTTNTPTNTQTPASTLSPTPTLTSNFCNPYNCNTPIRPPMTVNGIFITASLTGTPLNMPSSFSSCGGSVVSPTNILHLGYSSPYTYSLSFSSPINSIVMFITGAGILDVDCAETFTVLTNSGNPSIFSPTSCYTSINNNVITINTEGAPSVGGGGKFLIYNSTPFTNISVSGLKVCAGSYIVFCGDSLLCPESLPTQTPTITPTCTPTITKTITPTLTSNIQIIPKVDFVCVSWFNGPNSIQFINFLNGILNLYNKPIWVIEFAAQSVESAQLQPNLYTQEEITEFIINTVSWMNNNDMVERFSWKDSKSGTSSIFTIDGQLTETGITYRDAQ